MYDVPSYRIPEGCKMNDYAIKLCCDIRNNIDKEDAMDKLFRMTYPIMQKELRKYTNFGPLDELTPDLSTAFMKTVKKFNPDKTNASFVNYYKRALKTEILHNYYGKYKATEETRTLKKTFEGTMGYLDDPLYNKDSLETSNWYDMIQDKNVNIEEEILANDYKYTIHRIVNKIFDKKGRGRNTEYNRPKDMFTDYVDAILDDKKLTQKDIAKKYGIGNTGVCNMLIKYLPSFKEELKDMR